MTGPVAGPLTPEALTHTRGVTFTVPAGILRAMLTGLRRQPGHLVQGTMGMRWQAGRVELLWRSWELVHEGEAAAPQRPPRRDLSYTVGLSPLPIGRPHVWRLLALTAWPAPGAPPVLQVVFGSGREAGFVTGVLRSGAQAVPLQGLTLPGVGRIGTVDWPVRLPLVPEADRERWSRLRGALGDTAWGTLTSLTYCLIGVGCLGALLALSLTKAGVRTLILVDPGRLAPHHLVIDGVTPQDLGRLKVTTLGAWLRQVCPHTAVHTVPHGVDTPAGLAAARAADVLISCTPLTATRLVAGALACLDLKPVLDLQTRVRCCPGGTLEPSADIRLLVPGAGCLHCSDATPSAPRPGGVVLTHAGQSAPAGAWRSVNQTATHLGFTQLEHLVAGRLMHSTWLRLHWGPGGLPTLQAQTLPGCTPRCPLGGLVGQGDGLAIAPASRV